MNSRILLSAVALAFAIVVTGCSKSSKLNVPSKSPAPEAPVELKLKWTAGEHVVQEFTMDQDMVMNLPHQSGPMHQETAFGQKFSLKVLNANPDGGHDLEMQIQAVHVSVKTAGATSLDYDSDKPSAAGSANPVATTLGKIVGAKISYVLDQSNNVVSVQGVQDLVQRLQGGPSSAAWIKKTFSEEYFKQIMENSRFLPPDPVQPGDTWPVKISEPSAGTGTIDLDFTFTFKGWEMHGPRSCARVEFTGVMETPPGGTAGPMGMTMSIQNGTARGVYWWDPEFGMPIDSNLEEDMILVMELPKRMQAQVGAAVITNQLSQTINFKVDSLN